MSKGDRIRARRELLGMSQVDLAYAANTTKQNIYKYETGIISNIPSDKIERIAAALQTTPAYLMGWTDDPINYEDGDLLDSIPSAYMEAADGDPKKAFAIMLAVESDAQSEDSLRGDDPSIVWRAWEAMHKSSSKEAALPADEQKLLSGYRALSDQGKEYILQTLDMAGRVYIKNNHVSDVANG